MSKYEDSIPINPPRADRSIDGQTVKHSVVESVTNILIGYVVAVLSQMLVFPLFGIHIPVQENFEIGLWFTGISFVRSFILRRVFNRMTVRNGRSAYGKP